MVYKQVGSSSSSKKRKRIQKKIDKQKIINDISELTGSTCYNIKDALNKLDSHNGEVSMLNSEWNGGSLLKTIAHTKKDIHICGSLMTFNARSLKGKLDAEAYELWSLANKYSVVSLAIQDTHMNNTDNSLLTNAKYNIQECEENCNVSTQSGEWIPPTENTNEGWLGGTALINGGIVAKNSTIEIKDDRGWGRFSGRIIEGQKDDYNTTNLAVISYYGPVQGTGGTWGAQEKKIHTWHKSEKAGNTTKSNIDHIWVSEDLYNRGCILGTASAREQVAGSDHRPIVMHMDFTLALGIDMDHQEEEQQRRRIFKYVNKQQRGQYKTITTELWNKYKLTRKINDIIQNCVKGEITQEELDSVMQQVVGTMLEAEEALDPELAKKQAKKYRQGWSDQFMKKLHVISKCKSMLTHAKKGRKWEAGKMADILNERYHEWISIAKPPSQIADKNEWKRWMKTAEHAISDIKRTTHLKRRIEFRKQISEFAAAIERSRMHSTTCKKFYTYISDAQYSPPATQLYVAGRWVRGKEVLAAEEANLANHMSGRQDTYHYDAAQAGETPTNSDHKGEPIIDNPFCALTAAGKELRQDVANGGDTWKQHVPEQVHSFFELGARKIDPVEYGNIFSTAIDFKEFKRYIGYNPPPGSHDICVIKIFDMLVYFCIQCLRDLI